MTVMFFKMDFQTNKTEDAHAPALPADGHPKLNFHPIQLSKSTSKYH